jgi:hypothetical protein
MLYLCFIASYVHLSDSLIVMGNGGTINYMGPPDEWLSLNREKSAEIEASDEQPPKLPKMGKMGKMGMMGMMGRPDMGKVTGPGEDSTETVKRQAGDWGVWLYYGKAIGLFPILAAVACVIASVFTSNFPSECDKYNPISSELDNLILAELWLQWNTGSHTPQVSVFVGIYFMVSIISLLAMAAVF